MPRKACPNCERWYWRDEALCEDCLHEHLEGMQRAARAQRRDIEELDRFCKANGIPRDGMHLVSSYTS